MLAAREHVPVPLGGVVSSPAGHLEARGVKNVVRCCPDSSGSNRVVEDPNAVVTQATRQALDMVQAMRLNSIAFPALGTGHAKFDAVKVAIAMCGEIRAVLTASPKPLLVEIYLLLGKQRDYQAMAFFKHFTVHADLKENAVRSHSVVLVHVIRRQQVGERRRTRKRHSSLNSMAIGYGFFDVVRFPPR